MHWSDLTRPERALALTAKLFFGLFIFIVGVSMMLSILAKIQFSVVDLVGFLIVLALVSVTAYYIRERRNRERPRPRNTRGAERTPLLPAIEEEE